MKLLFVFLISLFSLIPLGGSTSSGDNAYPVSNFSRTFQSPSKDYRPKFRYWLPDASVPSNVIHRDIDSIARPPTDWAYGFGSPTFRNTLKAALEQTRDQDLLLDIVQGANQGQGVPSVPRTAGLALELLYGYTKISCGEKFHGPLPEAVSGNRISGFMHEPEKFGDPVLKVVLAGQVENTRYLPLLFTKTNQWAAQQAPYNETWAYGEHNSEIRGEVLRDYRTTLTELYQEYLKHFVEWSHSHGFEYSAQTAYNIPLDMSAAVPVPDAPETESLGFRTIDTMRQFSSPALLAGELGFSTEVGTIGNPNYTQTVPELIQMFKQAFAASVTQMVIDGFTYSGEYPLTGWPGYNTFSFLHTEMWNDKAPSFAQISEAFDYAARFSYDYLGPENLVLNATVVDWILAPSGPSYRALTFSNEAAISKSMLQNLEKYAVAGLPIFFIGQLPSDCFGLNDCPEGGVGPFIDSIISLYDNVQVVPNLSALEMALEDHSVSPRISFDQASEALYSVWRKSDDSDEDYIYLYNEGLTTTFNASYEASASSIPYILDAWTGEVSPVLHYTRSNSEITIPTTLQANQSRIYMLSPQKASPALHVISSAGEVNSISVSSNGELEARATGFNTLVLSDGRTITSNSPDFSATKITLWDLSLKSYVPAGPNTTATAFGQINHSNQPLKPWSQIPDLVTVSGIGEYNSTFNFPHDPEKTGALISFGPVKDTLCVWVNEQKILPIDITETQADITPFTKEGANTVRVVVTWNLFNAVKSRANSTISVGTSAAESNPFYEEAPWAEFGLIGPVEVQPMERIYIV